MSKTILKNLLGVLFFCLFSSLSGSQPAAAQEPVRMTTAQLWESGFAVSPRLPLVGDVDGDGRADLLALYPRGETILDLARTTSLGKPRFTIQARAQFGRDALAAACGAFTQKDRADVLGVFANGEVRVAHSLQANSYRYTQDGLAATLAPALRPKSPVRAVTADFDGDGKPDVLLLDADGALLLLQNESSAEGVPHFTPRPVSGRLPHIRRFAAGDLSGKGRADLVWLDDVGILNRAALKITPGEALLSPAVRVLMASPDEGMAVGHFSGRKSEDILIGRQLLVGGNPGQVLPQPSLPTPDEAKNDAAWIAGDFDGDGKDDLLRVRRSGERFVGNDIVLHFARLPGETAWNASTMQDGLLDIWKKGQVKPGDLDLTALGCMVGHRDVIVEVQRIADVPEEAVRSQVERAVKYFAGLPMENPDGTKGIALHVLYRDPIPLADKDIPWQTLGAKYHPASHRGITHWLVVYNGGGGQSAEMADRGSCGVRMLYATFLHEFGHQLGLDHTGHWGPNWCPTYPSLMNYAYNYQLNGRLDNIGYSDGRLASVVLNEKHLSEILPLPMEKVAFLSGPPYFYKLQPTEDGKGTLIDWNWNGLFGEKDVAADINYGYSTQGGNRNTITKTYTAPVLVAYGEEEEKTLAATPSDAKSKSASPNIGTEARGEENTRPAPIMRRGMAGEGQKLMLFCGRLTEGAKLPPADATAMQPSLSMDQPGRLRMRVWQGDNPQRDAMKWSEESDIEPNGVTGDASAVYFDGGTWIAYPMLEGSAIEKAAGGVVPREREGTALISAPARQQKNSPSSVIAIRRITLDAAGRPQIGPRIVVAETQNAQPTLTSFAGKLILLLWRSSDAMLAYRFLAVQGEKLLSEPEHSLEFSSNGPVGAAAGAVGADGPSLWLGVTQNQSPRLTSRWLVRRLVLKADGGLQQTQSEWIGGFNGGERGTGRILLLREDNPAFGPEGQLYFLGCGSFSDKSPWDCHYIATRIANKSVHGGWLTRRYYDEWTQSRSAPGACFFRGDIAFAARWFGNVHDTENDNLFVAFYGSGIESQPMGDFDDIGFIRDIGLSHSILHVVE